MKTKQHKHVMVLDWYFAVDISNKLVKMRNKGGVEFLLISQEQYIENIIMRGGGNWGLHECDDVDSKSAFELCSWVILRGEETQDVR